jgi:hypothetical protein
MEMIMAQTFRAAAESDTDLDGSADAVGEAMEPLFEGEPDLERWRLLTEAIHLHRQALDEPDGATRARMLQEVIRLHTRWAQSQASATSRSFSPRSKAW